MCNGNHGVYCPVSSVATVAVFVLSGHFTSGVLGRPRVTRGEIWNENPCVGTIASVLLKYLIFVCSVLFPAEEAERRLWSQSVQRGLPRPTSVNSAILRPRELQLTELQQVRVVSVCLHL